MKIGVFDSGIGGLNVLKELLKSYPNNYYIYYGDTLNVPYGNKSREELLNLSKKIIHFFEERAVDLIIIACGTISSNCYEELKLTTSIPLYDIISPTINYLNQSIFERIGLIGTTKTIESHIFEKRIINKKVLAKDMPIFVPIIEKNNIIENKELIQKELHIFKDKVDCLILGCTHYPLLKEVINEYLEIPLIDMGMCLGKTLKLTNSEKKRVDLYFSKLDEAIESNINKIILDEKKIYII